MAPVESLDHWLCDQERNNSPGVSSSRRSPNIIPIVGGASDSTLTSTNQVARPVPNRQSTSDSFSSTSSTSESAESVFSGTSAESDDTATTVGTDPIQEPTLHCDFKCTGCDITYPISNFQYWCRHTLSHFGSLPPPPKCICLYCPLEFVDGLDPQGNWQRRMTHCRSHLEGEGYRRPRPDFHLVDYLEENGLISPHDAAIAKSYTERPFVAGLVPRNFETPEAKARKERDERIERIERNQRNEGYIVDARKEKREQRMTSHKKNKT